MPRKLVPTPFKKGQKWNIFDAYEDDIHSKQATIEMKRLCDKFIADHSRLARKYQHTGIYDSAARDMIHKYIITHLH
jgi:hypothetical protein